MKERQRWVDILIKILRGLLLGAALVLLVFAAFFWFRVKSDGHLALRSAKNARFAIETVAIEFYGEGRNVFSPNSPDGMAKGVKERVQRLVGAEGEILLQEYDLSENRVVKMRYTEGSYIVSFSVDEAGNEQWKLAYLLDLDLL